MKRKRERLGQPRRYTFKLYPSKAQNEELFRQARMMVDLWNGLLFRNEQLYQRTRGQKGVTHAEGKCLLTYYDMTGEITQLRKACPEWAALSALSGYRVANSLAEAFQAFFRRMKEVSQPCVYEKRAAEYRSRTGRTPTRYQLAGYPRYRSARRAEWLPHRFASGCKLTPAGDERVRPSGRKSNCGWQLTLKGIDKPISARGEFPSDPLDWSDADLRFKDGAWWLSVGVERAPERPQRGPRVIVDFDLIDRFAAIIGANIDPPDFGPIQAAQDEVDALKSERDTRWPRIPGKASSLACREMSRRIARRSAHIARKRRELLHEWTTAVVAQAGELRIIAPSARDETRTARGNERSWGAAVGTVAALNRAVLSQAPASAVQMLKYKAEEALIPCTVIENKKPKIAIGHDLSATKKAARKARRIMKDHQYETV